MRSIEEQQLEIVYRQLARSTGFHGFRPSFLIAVAIVAAIATLIIVIAGSGMQAIEVACTWSGIAALIVVGVGVVVILPALRAGSSIARHAASGVVGQLLPSVGIGAVVTLAILLGHLDAIGYLPAIWLILFGLGVVAVAPLLYAPVEYGALPYLLGAAVAYALRTDDPAGFSLLVGIPFVAGHLVTGVLLSTPATGRSDAGSHE